SKTNTMSILYGNEIAVKFARAPTGKVYPAGAVLTLVTWKQKEDSHWFGAYIAGNVQQVEKIYFTKTKNADAEPVYEKYNGDSFTRKENV
ncbi:cytochrome P460 family protein, partial [Acinetobacter baumannii]